MKLKSTYYIYEVKCLI